MRKRMLAVDEGDERGKNPTNLNAAAAELKGNIERKDRRNSSQKAIDSCFPPQEIDRPRFEDRCMINQRKREVCINDASTLPSPSIKEPKFNDSVKELRSDPSASVASTSHPPEEVEEERQKPTPIVLPVASGEVKEQVQISKSLSHGSISLIGRRRSMEDAVTVIPGILSTEFNSYDSFAVYDGHGGSLVANACRDRLHQLIANEVEGTTVGGNRVDWEKVMAACFLKMDEEVKVREDVAEAVEATSMGSTALVVMVGTDELVVANCGDSRAVLCRDGHSIPLTRDHKPDLPDENERVETAGGMIIDWDGFRVLGVLATSRSVGIQKLKPFVSSEPEVTVSERTEQDEFLIIGSDGLWDVVSSEFACEVVKGCLDGQLSRRMLSEGTNGSRASMAAAILAEVAIAKGSKDNISVIVVELRKCK